jgi:hypothetical protein
MNRKKRKRLLKLLEKERFLDFELTKLFVDDLRSQAEMRREALGRRKSESSVTSIKIVGNTMLEKVS